MFLLYSKNRLLYLSFNIDMSLQGRKVFLSKSHW